MPPQLPNENTVKEQYDYYNFKKKKNVKIRKQTNTKIMYKKREMATSGMKAEANENKYAH